MTDTLPSEQPNRLYRYMSNMDYITDMLVHNRFYCSHKKEFNDPFDSASYFLLKGTREEWIYYVQDMVTKNITDEVYLDLVQDIKKHESKFFISDSFFAEIAHIVKDISSKDINQLLAKKEAVNSLYLEKVLEDAKGFGYDMSNIEDLNFYTKEKNTFRLMYSAINRFDFLDNFRLLCFSTLYDEILMWSHYANNHKGVCFGFENSLILKDNESYISHRATTYADVVKPIDIMSLICRKEVISDDFIFNKKKVWEYEKEYRYFFPIESLEEVVFKSGKYYRSFSPSILKEVIFGMYCDRPTIQTIASLVKNYYGEEVKFYRARPYIDQYKIEKDKYIYR